MRARLEDAAVELFHRKGFMATSVREVTSAVGVTVGALYNHFPSKEALLHAIISKAHSDLLRQLRAAVEGVDRPAEALREFVETYVLFYTRFPRESRVSVRDMEFLPPGDLEQIAEARRATRRLLQDVLEQGVEVGEFALLDSADMPPQRATAMAIMDMCVMVTEPYWLQASLSPRRIADLHVQLALRMVGVVDR
ncbi:TetR/AcrR family transcriptional regulator [Conexibacter arvalis]|uniref:AcrR family transcriptional regulator n=1 Tax=Conexibacter arvalis TaxID=912552 RepID=A0A840I6Y1_9ACTN|nr:TetR/AcrR family transcriptional regulator [Conexibacter arvalis]MBB4660649.1 AcrR family transcriptional regulator [Conexibacter arvalis]